MNNNSNFSAALTLLCLTALSSVAQAQEIPQIGRFGADMQAAPKTILPVKVVQVGAREHIRLDDQVSGVKFKSPFSGNIRLGTPPTPSYGFYMETQLVVYDNQSPPQRYTKGQIGEQLKLTGVFGPKLNDGTILLHDQQKYTDAEQGVQGSGHYGQFTDVNGSIIPQHPTLTKSNAANNPNEKWISLTQTFLLLDTTDPGFEPDPAVRSRFSTQKVANTSYQGLKIRENHQLIYYRAFYNRFIGGLKQD